MEYHWPGIRKARKHLLRLAPHEAWMAIPPHLIPMILDVALNIDEFRARIRATIETLPERESERLRLDDLAVPNGRYLATCDACTYRARCEHAETVPLDAELEFDFQPEDDPQIVAELGRDAIAAIYDAQTRISALHQALGRMLPYLHARELALIRRRLADEETLRQMTPTSPSEAPEDGR